MNMTVNKHRIMRITVLTGALLGVYAVSYAAEPIAYTPYGMNMDPSAWTKDRGGDPALVGTTWEGRDALKLSIKKPGAGDSFNNWQGHSQRTAAPSGESFLRGDLWVQSDWTSGTETDFQNTGMWGSAMPADTVAGGSYVDAQAVFPIMHFTNQKDSTGNPDGKGMLRIWDTTANPSGGWVYLTGTEGLIQYGGWNSIDLRLIPGQNKVEYYFNGSLVHTWVDPTSDNDSKPGQFFAMYLKARNNGVTEFDTYWSRLMSGAVYSEGNVSGAIGGDVMVDAGGRVSVADGTAISGSLYGNGSATAASIVNFDKSATIGGDLVGNNTWFNFSSAVDATAAVAGSIELEGKSLATGGSADKAVQAGRDIKLNDSTLKGYWTLPNGSIIAQGGARIEDATITATKTALKTSGSAPLVTVRNSSLKSTGAGTGFSGLVAAVNASNSSVVDIDGGSVAATGTIYTRGILATTGAKVTTANTDISTTGSKSHAVHAHVEKNDTSGAVPVVAINGGTISAAGDESWGLYSLRGGVITSSADISTAGKAGFGAFVEGNGETNARPGLITLNGGSITTSGQALSSGDGSIGSYGVLAKNIGNAVVMNGTRVTTSGNVAEGLRVEDKGQITASDSIIATSGSAAHGVTAYTGGKVDLVRGSVSASGANSNGLQAMGTGSKITTNGTAVTSSGGKYGAYSRNGGQIVLAGGSVSNTNTSPGSQGIAADGSGSSITATNVAISARGEYTSAAELSNAVAASNTARITLDGGSVSSLSSQYGRGLLASTGSSIIASNVAISTSGLRSNAVHAFGPSGISDPDSADAPAITLNAGTVNTSGDESYGLYAQNGGNIISSAHIKTTGKAGFGAFAYNGGRISLTGGSLETSAEALNGTIGTFGVLSKRGSQISLDNTRVVTRGALAEGVRVEWEPGAGSQVTLQNGSSIATSGAGAHGIGVYGEDSGGTSSNTSATMTGGSITTAGSGASGAYLSNGGSVTLNGVTVNAAGPVFSSDFNKAGQSQSITVGAGSTLASLSDILLRVDRSTAGGNGVVNFTLEDGAFASGNIENYRDNTLVDRDAALTNADFRPGSHWAGIFINASTLRPVSGVPITGDADGKVNTDVATTAGSSVTFQGVSQVAGSVSTATNSSTTFSGSTPITITQNLIGQQGSSITFNNGATINQSVTGVGSTMSFGGATTISQGVAGSGSSMAFSGPTTIGNGTGSALTGASNSSFSFSRTAPTTINGSVDLSGGSSTHGGTVSTPVTITGDAVVSSGAVLGGNLNVQGALSGSGGILGPGNSVGTQTYATMGAFTDGTYLAEVNAAGQSDLIRITSGPADLTGIALKVGQENGNGGYVLNHDYTIVQTGDATGISSVVGNKFSSEALDGSFAGALVKLDPVKYGDNSVRVRLSLDQSKADALVPTLSSNQRAVYGGVLSVMGRNSAADAALQSSNPKDALNQLSGEVHGSTQSALYSAGGLLVSTVGNRMRGNVGAGLLAGAPMADASGSVPAGAMPKSAAYPLWAQVVGNWNTLDGDDNASRTRSHTAGLYVGGDVPVGAGWRVGGALGFTDGRINADDVGSRSDVRSYTATVYGGNSWAAGSGQVNFLAGAGYTRHDIESRRSINVGGSQTLKADYHANTTQLFTELGYALPVGQASTIEPYAGLAWYSQRSPGFSESGGSAALRGNSQTDNVTTVTLGLRGKTAVELGRHEARLSAGLGWRHASGDVASTRTMSFIQGNGAAFTVAGAPIAKNAAVVDLGAEMNVGKNAAMGLGYSGQFGQGSTDSTGSLYVKVRF
ncbi:autotransporter domain-containing protein [Pollutimonas sp. H1-120]|uniref:autotransporter domain-containing protein n=1 Tax=Pollutimonas sp. H1-120 TaxID=3148824 RepID=UPI003B5173D0